MSGPTQLFLKLGYFWGYKNVRGCYPCLLLINMGRFFWLIKSQNEYYFSLVWLALVVPPSVWMEVGIEKDLSNQKSRDTNSWMQYQVTWFTLPSNKSELLLAASFGNYNKFRDRLMLAGPQKTCCFVLLKVYNFPFCSPQVGRNCWNWTHTQKMMLICL
jgi:hypothetical protein